MPAMRPGQRSEPKVQKCPEASLLEEPTGNPQKVAHVAMRVGTAATGGAGERRQMDKGQELVLALELADEFTAAIGPPTSLQPLPIFKDMIEPQVQQAGDRSYGEA